jgi:lysyl-tRNA synthetase class 1
VKVPFEWVRLGGRDMGTSRGYVFTPGEWLKIAPPELFRYMVLRTDPEKANNIQTNLIPDLVDIYESFEREYYGFDDVENEKQELAKILYPLTEVRPKIEEYIPKLPFKFAVVTSQLQGILNEDTILERCYTVLRKHHNLKDISEESKALIPTRLSRALHWVKDFGSERDKVAVPDQVPKEIIGTLTDTDREFLKKFVEILEGPALEDEELQGKVFETARSVDLKEKRAFVVLYRILISRKSGPRLGGFLNLLGNEWVLNRIMSVL